MKPLDLLRKCGSRTRVYVETTAHGTCYITAETLRRAVRHDPDETFICGYRAADGVPALFHLDRGVTPCRKP